MNQARIAHLSSDLKYGEAAMLAMTFADWSNSFHKPVLLASYSHRAARMSPSTEGADQHSLWRNNSARRGGKLEIDVAGEFSFVYADSGATGDCSLAIDHASDSAPTRPRLKIKG